MMIFNILFNQGYVQDLSNKDKPVRFLFTDYSRLSSVGGETSLAEMVGALSKTAERNFGVLATRIYRAMKPHDDRPSTRKVCCLPISVIFALLIFDIVILTIIIALHFKADDISDPKIASYETAYWTLGSIAVALIILSLIPLWPVFYHLGRISYFIYLLNHEFSDISIPSSSKCCFQSQ